MNIPRLAHEQYGERFVLVPSFSRYANGRLAFQLYTHDGELFAPISVNLPNDQVFNDAEFFCKNYAENELIVQALEEEGWIVRTQRYIQAGYVIVPVVRLAGPLLDWYNTLLEEEIES